jgi:hypothetical protein
MYATNVKSKENIVKRALTDEELNAIANNTLIQVEAALTKKPISVGDKSKTGTGGKEAPPPPPGFKRSQG